MVRIEVEVELAACDGVVTLRWLHVADVREAFRTQQFLR